MSGIFDLHTTLALQNGWEWYRTNQAGFRSLFMGLRDDVLNDWHSELVAKPPVFRTHAAAGVGDFPAVIVQLMNESRLEEPLGGFSRSSTGIPIFTSVIEQRIKISMLSNNAEITRALHVVTRAIMFGSLHRFVDQGYMDLQYLEAEELAPAEELVAEEMGIFLRRQVWKSTATVDSPSFEQIPQEKAWFVQAEDIVTQPTTGSAYDATTKTGDWQPAPIDPSLINPATNEPYPPQRKPADEEYGNPPFDGVTGDAGGVKPKT